LYELLTTYNIFLLFCSVFLLITNIKFLKLTINVTQSHAKSFTTFDFTLKTLS